MEKNILFGFGESELFSDYNIGVEKKVMHSKKTRWPENHSCYPSFTSVVLNRDAVR